MDKWKNVMDMISYPDGGITSKVVYSTNESNVTLFCMGKGTETTEHTSTKDGVILVLDGYGTFNLAGQEIKMVPGIVIFMDKNTVHSLKAIKNTSFILSLHS